MSLLFNLITEFELENKRQDILDKLIEELKLNENEEQNTYNPLEYLYKI